MYKTYALNVMVNAFTSLYFVVTLLPLAIYTTMQIAREKESGMLHFMFSNGLNPALHFISWLIFYAVINLLISLFYVATMGPIIFKEDS